MYRPVFRYDGTSGQVQSPRLEPFGTASQAASFGTGTGQHDKQTAFNLGIHTTFII